jgi:tRNA U34 5-methylaminomethyl-2-thiouridine-forming methyltransferase MnmC
MKDHLPRLIITKDGSHSLLNEQLNETYHSVHGAIQESRYVFIEQGLKFSFNENASSVSIFEVGFGTGLNALLTIEHVKASNRPVSYTTIEAFPLSADTWVQLNYAEVIGLPDEFRSLHNCDWNRRHPLVSGFDFLKQNTTLQLLQIEPGQYDIIFYDAFAPSKQPEMWAFDILTKVVYGLRPGGIFVTYCAKGQLKRDLRALGLAVETLPGPPGKKEMVRARKMN